MLTSVPVGVNTHTETCTITIDLYMTTHGFDCVAYAEFDFTHVRDRGVRDGTG